MLTIVQSTAPTFTALPSVWCSPASAPPRSVTDYGCLAERFAINLAMTFLKKKMNIFIKTKVVRLCRKSDSSTNSKCNTGKIEKRQDRKNRGRGERTALGMRDSKTRFVEDNYRSNCIYRKHTSFYLIDSVRGRHFFVGREQSLPVSHSAA